MERGGDRRDKMTKEHKAAIVVAIITLVLILIVTVFRNGTSW